MGEGTKMFKFPLERYTPDFETFEKVLRGEKKPEKVHFVELWIDEEIVKFITENMIGEKWIPRNGKNDKIYWKQYVNFYYRMGYDYLPVQPMEELEDIPSKERGTNDTALLSKGKRIWAEEGRGVITSWEDFEQFPWEKVKLNLKVYEYLSKNLPEGMKIVFWEARGLYEYVLENLLGYQGLFYLLYDQPNLVEAVFNKWGEIIHEIYKTIIVIENVGAIFHADDLGYKTGTMVKPEILRKIIFPWFKKYASLAHKHGKMYWCRCCGNVLEIMEDLIEDVKIDAFHSFQDVIIPVTEFKKIYENRIATLGGIDMDKLCRLDEENLRKYVKSILDECMSDGRYALGSGNSIANYVPVKNYIIMLEEGLRWR